MRNESTSVLDRSNASNTPEPEYTTIKMSGFLRAVRRRKNLVRGFALGGLVIGILAAYALRPRYDAIVRFLPPTQKETPPLSLFKTQNTGDRYLGLVNSRTVADDVIDKQHLMQYFHAKNLSGARRKLESISKIAVDKDQFVTVRVRAAEPQTAMNIANEYLAALHRLDNQISVDESVHRTKFYEEPLRQEKNNLTEAEEQLKQAQQNTGIVMPEAQVRLGVTALAQLRQEIASREVLLASLRTGGTEQNPRVIQLKSQIDNLNEQIQELERKQTGGQGVSASTSQLPALEMDVVRRTRDVKYHETVFEILSKQYEYARVDQSYTPSIEVVDRAILPDEKAWPPRKLFMLGGLVGGWLLGLGYVAIASADLPRRWREATSGDESATPGDASHI
jgi:tyrosine-protein kinase Etk/Wzc